MGARGGRGIFASPRDADRECDAVTEAGAEVHGMVTSCVAAVGDTWMTVPVTFMKVVKTFKKQTARFVPVSDDLLMRITCGYGSIAYLRASVRATATVATGSSAAGGGSARAPAARRYADGRHLRNHLRERKSFDRKG
jgi:hypothetical protein